MSGCDPMPNLSIEACLDGEDPAPLEPCQVLATIDTEETP